MALSIPRDKIVIFAYFSGIILVGSLFLMLPGAWTGPSPLSYVDALFTATSAVCVTGLITVDTALYSRFGLLVIMALIQAGGLGIITFATLYVTSRKRKISLVNSSLIRDFYVGEVEHEPRAIIANILVITFTLEIIGALLLWLRFRGLEGSGFVAAFHAVSAFCNAGFSTFSTNLEAYVGDPLVNLTIMGLVVAGGLGFIVFRDIGKRLRGERRRLSTHSRIALAMTALLVIGGALAFFLLEAGHSMKGLPPGTRILASLFAAVTPRTAGFDTIAPARFSGASVLLTMVLMFIGASPASTGGGVKTTTVFILALAALRGVDEEGRLNLGRRAIGSATILKAVGIVGKGLLLVVVSTIALLLIERPAVASGHIGVTAALYEVMSAFGTVGLSLGITGSLAPAAKLVLIFTMFAGRVGLFAMSLPSAKRHLSRYARLPESDVIVG